MNIGSVEGNITKTMTARCSCGCDGYNTDKRLITTTEAIKLLWSKQNRVTTGILTVILVIATGLILAGYTYAVWTLARRAATTSDSQGVKADTCKDGFPRDRAPLPDGSAHLAANNRNTNRNQGTNGGTNTDTSGCDNDIVCEFMAAEKHIYEAVEGDEDDEEIEDFHGRRVMVFKKPDGADDGIRFCDDCPRPGHCECR